MFKPRSPAKRHFAPLQGHLKVTVLTLKPRLEAWHETLTVGFHHANFHENMALGVGVGYVSTANLTFKLLNDP